MLDAATYAEPDPNACMDQGDAPQSSAAEPDNQHDAFVRTVFGADPSSYAASAGSSPPADDPPPVPDAVDDPAPDDTTASETPDVLPEGKPFEAGVDQPTPGPGLDPETSGPLDPPSAADPAPVPYSRDMDPETGEPWPEPPHAADPDANGTEPEPEDDPEANVGRGAGPADTVPYEASAAPGERVLLGMPQREQAADNMAKMSPEDHAQVQALLEVAASHSPDEVEYVVKAVAAGHSVTELKAFQQQIAGKDQAWMDQNLRLVGGSSGKGIKQQWSHSCASTEVEAMKGELDPIYAFQLRQKNPKLDQADDKDGNALNPDLANEQFRLLTETGGSAASRGDADHGRGGKMSTVLNSEAAGMGLTFDRNDIGKDATMDEALATAQQKLKSGMPVPICVGDDANPFAHAAMMTAVDDGPPRRFYIHDPWTGSVKGYSEADIRDGKLDVGSCKKLAAIYPPHRK